MRVRGTHEKCVVAMRAQGARRACVDGSHTLAILKLLRDIKELVPGCNVGPELLGHADGRAVRVTDCKTCECTQFVPYNDRAAGYETGRERRHRRRAARQKQGVAKCPRRMLPKIGSNGPRMLSTGALRLQTLILSPTVESTCMPGSRTITFLGLEKFAGIAASALFAQRAPTKLL